jgi:MraZ protein
VGNRGDSPGQRGTALLQGASQLTLDDKGRLAIPTRYRDALLSGGKAVVLTAHPDGCLLLYPPAAWEPVRGHIQSLSSFNPQARWWQRLLVGHAEELELDAQGRALISQSLRSFAALKKDVTLVGQGNRFEIWDSALLEEKRQQALEEMRTAPPPGTENFSL